MSSFEQKIARHMLRVALTAHGARLAEFYRYLFRTGATLHFTSRQNKTLFYKADIGPMTDAQLRNATNEIQGIDPDRLLNTPVDDLVEYIAGKYRIEVPALHRDRAVLDEPEESFVEVND